MCVPRSNSDKRTLTVNCAVHCVLDLRAFCQEKILAVKAKRGSFDVNVDNKDCGSCGVAVATLKPRAPFCQRKQTVETAVVLRRPLCRIGECRAPTTITPP